VAEVTASGDPQHAKEQAARLCAPVIDFLQLIAAIDDREGEHIRVVLGGEVTGTQAPQLVIYDDRTQLNWDYRFLRNRRLELTQGRIKRVVDRGLSPLLAALSKTSDERSEFEDLLLTAVRWIADAETQSLPENRITSFVTSMELFFTKENAPIGRDLSESIACILADNLEARKELKKLVSTLYEKRSKISHEGQQDGLIEAAAKLKRLAINVLAAMCGMSDRFRNKEDVRTFFADLRLSGRFE
jgi:hypothetical protein